MLHTRRTVRAQDDQQASSTKFLRAISTLLGVLTSAAVMVLLAGCGSGPDVEGHWEGAATIPNEGELPFTLDLSQGDANDVQGTITIVNEGDEDTGSLAGTVDSDGAFQLDLGSGMTLNGEVEGTTMTGQWLNEGEAYDFTAERISGDEAAARREEREATRREQERRAEEEADELAAVKDRHDGLLAEVSQKMRDVGGRVSVLRDAAGQGPAEQLSDELGPEDTDEDLYACATGGASCEVGQLESRLESDAEDLAEDSCERADLDYYAEYSFADQNSYPEERDAIARAADGLAEDANEMEAQAQEMELVKREVRELGGNPAGGASAADATTWQKTPASWPGKLRMPW